MFEWLLVLLFNPVTSNVAPPSEDFVGVVAAEVAYASFLPDKEVKPSKPIDPNCPVCKGTGRVRTGDDQGIMKCPRCQAESSAAGPAAPGEFPKVIPAPSNLNPEMRIQVKPLANPATGSCPNGACKYLRS